MKILPVFLLLFFIMGCSSDPVVEPIVKELDEPSAACESVNSKNEVDLTCIENHLKTEGLGGWVHASVADQQMFVFTWRRPGNFFVNLQLPMSSKDPEIIQKLSQLKRHDQIVLKGLFFKNQAPLKHINVTEIEVVKAYEGSGEAYEYDLELPAHILNSSSVIGKVHAVANQGKVLVIEVGDRVYPVYNSEPSLAQSLYRNDKIQLQYSVRSFPDRPPHLAVNIATSEPIRVLEEIVAGHGEPIVLSGPLVMFPQSPQIKFNVFALRTEDADGIRRNHTIINFEDMELFNAIRQKLQKVWTEEEETAHYDRNKYINPRVQVTIKGLKNLVSPTQANPQIMVDDVDKIKIEVL